MYIVPISDVHTELATYLFRDEEIKEHFNFLQPLLDTGKTVVLVAAGDIGRNFSGVVWLQRVIQLFPGLKVVFTPGNHEYYGSQLEDLYQQYKEVQLELGPVVDSNLFILAGSWAVIDNVVFIGDTLWTDCNNQDPAVIHRVREDMNDYNYTYNSHGKPVTVYSTIDKHYTQVKSIFKILNKVKDLHKISEGLKVAVVTHHNPLKPSSGVDLLSYAFCCMDVEDKLATSENIPDYWFYGHTHTSGCTRRDYEHGTCEFISNQLGYSFEDKAQTQYQRGFYIEV